MVEVKFYVSDSSWILFIVIHDSDNGPGFMTFWTCSCLVDPDVMELNPAPSIFLINELILRLLFLFRACTKAKHAFWSSVKIHRPTQVVWEVNVDKMNRSVLNVSHLGNACAFGCLNHHLTYPSYVQSVNFLPIHLKKVRIMKSSSHWFRVFSNIHAVFFHWIALRLRLLSWGI